MVETAQASRESRFGTKGTKLGGVSNLFINTRTPSATPKMVKDVRLDLASRGARKPPHKPAFFLYQVRPVPSVGSRYEQSMKKPWRSCARYDKRGTAYYGLAGAGVKNIGEMTSRAKRTRRRGGGECAAGRGECTHSARRRTPVEMTRGVVYPKTAPLRQSRVRRTCPDAPFAQSTRHRCVRKIYRDHPQGIDKG